jgi:hypothetical protein
MALKFIATRSRAARELTILPVSWEKLIEFLNVVIVDLALDGTDCAAFGMIGSYERPSPASQQTQSRPAQAMPPLFVPSQPPATFIDDRWLDVGFPPPLAGIA